MRRLSTTSAILIVRTLRTTVLCPSSSERHLRRQVLVDLLDESILQTLCGEGRIDQGGKVTSALATAEPALGGPTAYLSADLLFGALDDGGYPGVGARTVTCRIAFETRDDAAIDLVCFQM